MEKKQSYCTLQKRCLPKNRPTVHCRSAVFSKTLLLHTTAALFLPDFELLYTTVALSFRKPSYCTLQ